MKKLIAILLVAGIVSVSLGCGGAATTPKAGSSTVTTKTGGEVPPTTKP